MQNISAIISHDLVNSLSPIISITELLLYDSKDANYIEDLEMIHQSGCNALTLSRDLLDAYKLDLKKLELVKKNTKISQLLGGHCDKDNITIENLVESREVCVDRQRIEQIICNLVLNAQDFGTKITIRAEPIEGAIKISVQDNGIGIPKEKRHILFRQFGENIHVDVKRRKPRTGLGLFICKELVELHGGKIWLDEEYCDGAKFCFTIPILL
jgi:signal transduction histidine kinase